MKVGVIGVGDMGLPIAGHLIGKQHTVSVYDVNSERAKAGGERGAAIAGSLAELARLAEVFVVMVSTDAQSREVTTAICEHAAPGSLVAVAATNHPETMVALKKLCAARGIRFIDAPVVYGASGAKEGTLLSLCGGDEADVEFARPVLSAYSSRGVLRVGPVGAGQLAKACNNLLHWVHCVSNFEALLLAKRYGVDAQRMREVLLECPAYNGTLARWDTTRFTWQEKDMDVTMDLAQDAGLVLPLSGQVDQLVKL
ncbi:MAG TPA: NAD(P)-dependent oxidoreductase, partial [Xanthobacteraceae bacterium]|nr:NAD(P)-dependent oxidoreductase [Xanthobacteraceae bacterium]